MADSEPIRVGLIGIGRAGWGMHTKAIDARPGKFRIVAACDPVKSRRDVMAERYGCTTYRDAADLAVDPEVELVDIASRTVEHVTQAVFALKAGKDVFLEKPIAVTYAEARKIERALRGKGRGRVYARHNRRFEPAFQHVREIMAAGTLGDVYEIKLRRHGYQRRNDWQTLIAHAGGQLLNWGPHVVDHALQLLESPVSDMWSDLTRVAAVGDAEDHLKIILKGENGRLVDLEISGGAALSEPEYIVFGTRGALVCKGREIQLRYLDPGKKLARARAKSSNPPFQGGFGNAETLPWIEETLPVSPKAKCDTPHIWDHLYAAIREGVPFPITLQEALAVMRVISAVKKGTPFEATDVK